MNSNPLTRMAYIVAVEVIDLIARPVFALLHWKPRR